MTCLNMLIFFCLRKTLQRIKAENDLLEEKLFKQRETMRKVNRERNAKLEAVKEAEVNFNASQKDKEKLLREIDTAQTSISAAEVSVSIV